MSFRDNDVLRSYFSVNRVRQRCIGITSWTRIVPHVPSVSNFERTHLRVHCLLIETEQHTS